MFGANSIAVSQNGVVFIDDNTSTVKQTFVAKDAKQELAALALRNTVRIEWRPAHQPSVAFKAEFASALLCQQFVEAASPLFPAVYGESKSNLIVSQVEERILMMNSIAIAVAAITSAASVAEAKAARARLRTRDGMMPSDSQFEDSQPESQVRV